MELRNTRSMGRLGAVTLGYYLCTTGIAITIGLIVVFFIHPWTAFVPLVQDPGAYASVGATAPRLIDPGDGSLFSLANTLLQRMLSNPFAALSDLNILGILVAALLFGTAMALTIADDSPLPRILADITQSLYRLAGWVLKALPIGLFAITYQLSAQINLDTVAALLQFSAWCWRNTGAWTYCFTCNRLVGSWYPAMAFFAAYCATPHYCLSHFVQCRNPALIHGHR